MAKFIKIFCLSFLFCAFAYGQNNQINVDETNKVVDDCLENQTAKAMAETSKNAILERIANTNDIVNAAMPAGKKLMSCLTRLADIQRMFDLTSLSEIVARAANALARQACQLVDQQWDKALKDLNLKQNIDIEIPGVGTVPIASGNVGIRRANKPAIRKLEGEKRDGSLDWIKQLYNK